MSKFFVSKICLAVAANFVLINYPTLAATLTSGQFATETNNPVVILNSSYLAQAANQQSKEVEDPIFEDIVLDRVDKLNQFINS